jgi:uncharacterized membrane protein YraQ (UPF0718 family)
VNDSLGLSLPVGRRSLRNGSLVYLLVLGPEAACSRAPLAHRASAQEALERGCTIRIIAEAFAMNPALRFISSRSFLELFSLFGLLCSLAVFVLIGLR